MSDSKGLNPHIITLINKTQLLNINFVTGCSRAINYSRAYAVLTL
jgi:hypothetical protein